jgi:hypothetical protein
MMNHCDSQLSQGGLLEAAYDPWIQQGPGSVAMIVWRLLRQAEFIYCTTVVAGELHFGFRQGSNVKKNTSSTLFSETRLSAFSRSPWIRQIASAA